MIDPADLVTANEVAEIIGLNRGSNVGVYLRRYPDFPRPVIEKGRCKHCRLWDRRAITEWAIATGRTLR